MSLDLLAVNQLPDYDDDEEEIQLMDTDGNNLQFEEQQPSIKTTTTVENIPPEQDLKNKNDEQSKINIEQSKSSSFHLREKLKVYIRDGANAHHVETISVDEKYYDLPSVDQLASMKLTQETMKDIWQSLSVTEEDFRSSSSPFGLSRPESLYIRGVNNMSTQEILNCFEQFQPIGIEWISDQSCNVFWHDTLSPLRFLASKSTTGSSIAHRRPVHFDLSMRLSKRKLSSSPSKDINSTDVPLSSAHWRETIFQLTEKSTSSIVVYVRYTTLDDRKVRGAENQSEYYRQHGNPNYENMTGLISRSKKRALNAMKSNHFRDFTVVKSNDSTAASATIIEETTTSEENTVEAKVSFTVVLPPKKAPSVDEDDEEDEKEHPAKRQRRRRRSQDSDDEKNDRRQKEKTHFTVTIDSASKHTKDPDSKFHDTSRPHIHKKSIIKDDDDTNEEIPVMDARQILERKRRNRK